MNNDFKLMHTKDKHSPKSFSHEGARDILHVVKVTFQCRLHETFDIFEDITQPYTQTFGLNGF